MSNFSFTLSSHELLAVANFFSEFEGTILLFSGGVSETVKFSYLGLFPHESVLIRGDTLVHNQGSSQILKINNPWDALQNEFFSKFSQSIDSFAFGWLSYQMGFTADLDYHFNTQYTSTTPDAYWQRCAVTLIFNHEMNECSVQLELGQLLQMDKCYQEWIQKLSIKDGWIELLKKLSLDDVLSNTQTINKIHEDQLSSNNFINKVQKAQEYIKAGEIYQVNLSQPFFFDHVTSPFKLFYQMCINHPAPFSAFINTKELAIVSISPERFLCKQGETLETRPIKGTIKRGTSEASDKILKETLLNSEKERAELLMITDLMRNDLGKISQVGSVHTLSIWKCETYSKVFHLVSIIQSLAKITLNSLEIVRSCFPGGSITGCPKLRSMEIINELEDIPRGLYTGSIGYFKSSGDFDLNIAIRTLVILKNGPASLHLGSGIVYDSDPLQEYYEILAKGASFFESMKHPIEMI
ncbi:MAG: anthranilate synthase component I family protein [Parachlamydiaceae bacterium]|nr:anthranilate synthase component I family protein [Parachlamydiaceae bacterium]